MKNFDADRIGYLEQHAREDIAVIMAMRREIDVADARIEQMREALTRIVDHKMMSGWQSAFEWVQGIASHAVSKHGRIDIPASAKDVMNTVKDAIGWATVGKNRCNIDAKNHDFDRIMAALASINIGPDVEFVANPDV